MYSTVTHIFSQTDRTALAGYVEKTAAQSFSQFWFAGWNGEIEAALLDAVFSARSTYGGPATGVRRLVSRWRAHRAGDRIDDLSALAAFVDRSDDLADILGNRQRVAGNSTIKADAAARIASILVDFGVHGTEQLFDDDSHRAAVTALAGVGPKTWEAIFFMSGLRTLDAHRLVAAFVSDAVGREVDGDAAGLMLSEHAESVGVEYRALEHAVWRYQRRIGWKAARPTLRETG